MEDDIKKELTQEQLKEIAKNIEMIKVFSTNVLAIGYNEEYKILKVIFKGNNIYIYENVEPEIYQALKSSDHIGSYLSEAVIKNKEKYKYI